MSGNVITQREHPVSKSARRAVLPPVVAMGASAGCIEALKAFFESGPSSSGMAYVIVTHHDAMRGVSLMDALGQSCTLPMIEVQESTPILAGHVYFGAERYIRLRDDMLECTSMPAETERELPVDFFFRSLAGEQRERSICIVLSGTGSDGTLGLQAVKGEGGLAIAQEMTSAQYSGMPGSAIATGLVDYVLEPAAMPKRLEQYIQNMPQYGKENINTLLSEALHDILGLLRQHMGHDFSNYKANTLCRRIERRMNVHHIGEPRNYIRYLRENPYEIGLLFKELLIGVTSFFRDPDAFEIIAQEVLPKILSKKTDDDTLRIWVAGCSTGEEAYTLAMLVQEYMQEHRRHFNVQIFATDLDEKAIGHARNGVYAEGIALDVDAPRLQRHFTREDSHYRVKKSIREMVIFATQNLIQDPPFTKLDLISCRNLLIYLDGKLQKRVIPQFHYSLIPGGVLFLGSSETVGAFTELFNPIHARWKIMQRQEVPLSSHRLTRFTDFPPLDGIHYPTSTAHGMSTKKSTGIVDIAQHLLLNEHIPASVIVNEKGIIFFVHGRTGVYLEMPGGQPKMHQNILDMARDGLHLALAALIRKAAMQDAPVLHSGIRVKVNDQLVQITLRARKVLEPETLRGLIWISFEPEPETGKKTRGKKATPPIDSQQLEHELNYFKQNLQSTIEELETANEELKSTNEELQSTNEELQSANEELETAKEEMQSLNEELQTVNMELETKIHDLSYANDDMKNLLNSTGVATIFLDNNLHIMRFTTQAKRFINLIQTDIGRPISDIASQLEYYTLVKDAIDVLQTLVFKEIEVRARDWSWYLMRIMPYRTAENVIDGLVLTFVDITRLKKSETILAIQKTALALIVKQAPQEETLDEVLRTVERCISGVWCSISLLDESGKTLRHGAAPNLPTEFNRVLDGIAVDVNATAPCAQSVYQRRAILLTDIPNDPVSTEFHALAMRYELSACWSHPIYCANGKILGTYTVYYRQPHEPSSAEIELFNQIVPVLGIAISHSHEAQP